MRPTGAFLYLLAVSLPVAIYVADAMATHCVYWMTASWSLDHASMCRTRDAWRSRFDPASPYSLTTRESGASRLAHLGAAAIRQHTAYRLGPVWLLAAIVWPTCLILATSPRGADAIVPLRVVVGVVLGLLVAGLVRSQLRFEAAVHFWRALVHWLHYDDGPMPPWVFHSPCGPPQRRRLMTSVAVCLFSVPIFGMSATGLWGCVMESNMFPALIPPPTDLDSAFAQIHAAVSHASKLASLRGLLFLALAMVSLLVIPPAVLLLAMFLLIGPLVLTYYEVYEKQERL
jgi:hypothetical protein